MRALLELSALAAAVAVLVYAAGALLPYVLAVRAAIEAVGVR